MRRRLPFLGLVLLLSGALLATAVVGLVVLRLDRVVVAPGKLAGGSIPVTAPRAGRVAQVLEKAGDRAEAGQALVRLESEGLAAEARELEHHIASREERARSLRERGARLEREVIPRESEQAERAVQRARLELHQAEVRANAMEELGGQGLAGRLDVEQAKLARRLAEMELEEATQEVPLLRVRQRSRSDEIEVELRSVEGEVAEAGTRLAELRRQISISTVVAPAAGAVTGGDLEELPGRRVEQGDELLRLAVAPAERFEGALNDSGRARARPGQPVRIRMDGYPWLIHGSLEGRVETIASVRDAAGGFPVSISFDPDTAPGPLYEGMGGRARIVIQEKTSLGRLLLERLAGSDGP